MNERGCLEWCVTYQGQWPDDLPTARHALEWIIPKARKWATSSADFAAINSTQEWATKMTLPPLPNLLPPMPVLGTPADVQVDALPTPEALSAWLPGTQNPWEPGIYEIAQQDPATKQTALQQDRAYWNGKKWSVGHLKSSPRRNWVWRGLAAPWGGAK